MRLRRILRAIRAQVVEALRWSKAFAALPLEERERIIRSYLTRSDRPKSRYERLRDDDTV